MQECVETWEVCMSSNLTPPPLIFIGGSLGRAVADPRWTDVGSQCHASTWPCWPTTMVGQPAQGANRPQLLGFGLVCASSCPNTESWPVLISFALVFGLHLVQLSLNLCSNFVCDFISDQSVLATYKLAWKHNLQFSRDKVCFGIYLIDNACKKCKLS